MAVATIKLESPFHSADCEGGYETGYGQFNTWSKDDRAALMETLVTIILDLQLHGYGSVVPIPIYQEIFPESTDPFDPYYLAVRHTIINMAHIGAREQEKYLLEAGVECWFERGDTDAETCRIFNALASLKSWEQSKSLTNIHFDGKSLPQLQAADLVAREAFKHFKNKGVRKTRIPVDRMRNLLNFAVWNRECLEYLRDHGGPQDLNLTSWGAPERPAPPSFSSYWKDF